MNPDEKIISDEEIIDFFSYTEVPAGLEICQGERINNPEGFVNSHLTILAETKLGNPSRTMCRVRLLMVMKQIEMLNEEAELMRQFNQRCAG